MVCKDEYQWDESSVNGSESYIAFFFKLFHIMTIFMSAIQVERGFYKIQKEAGFFDR